ncbi:DUF4920 domain-containing protein [Luteimonas sp. RD2P54]|uniref:DUF4920 domain-containing protein n=1 Tax=Luteimonas endophytica TaxID=3042023 RepID=A0ABT6J8D2_9GAMM|nr:DUF4920 domain-containing protein [Luteimonas endophytica]MDH5823081.1 DUF4920 domain-containing protein [Luteimonas endophytica]
MRPPVLSLALLLASGAVHAGPQVYGEPLPPGEAVPVSAAIADFTAHAETPRRFSGRIAQVCQAKGCWMMLEQDGRAARVMFGDHAFYIPKDSTGAAEVHGVLTRHELTEAAARHLAEDAGQAAPAPSVEYRIVADGVEIAAP